MNKVLQEPPSSLSSLTSEERTSGKVRRDVVFKSNGKVAWHIGFTAREITLSCYNYTRWKDFRGTIDEILAKVFSSSIRLLTVKMAVLDRFDVDSKEDFPLESLFRKGSPLIAAAFLTAPFPPATSFVELYEPAELLPWKYLGERFAVYARSDATPHRLSFVIDNMLSVLREKDAVLSNQVAYLAAVAAIDLMHGRNKDTLHNVLTDHVLERIGIKGGG